jgi:hypothetical protein
VHPLVAPIPVVMAQDEEDGTDNRRSADAAVRFVPDSSALPDTPVANRAHWVPIGSAERT